MCVTQLKASVCINGKTPPGTQNEMKRELKKANTQEFTPLKDTVCIATAPPAAHLWSCPMLLCTALPGTKFTVGDNMLWGVGGTWTKQYSCVNFFTGSWGETRTHRMGDCVSLPATRDEASHHPPPTTALSLQD